jgi:hypothetical protein
MKIHMSRRLFLAAAVVGALALFAAAFFVALTVRSVVAGPSASPGGPVPNPGHAWTEIQDHGIDGGDYWLGTIDMQALELRVNGERALRLEPNDTSPNVIGGLSGNAVTAGVVGATIGGGGEWSGTNWVTDHYGTVGGGVNNQAGDRRRRRVQHRHRQQRHRRRGLRQHRQRLDVDRGRGRRQHCQRRKRYRRWGQPQHGQQPGGHDRWRLHQQRQRLVVDRGRRPKQQRQRRIQPHRRRRRE